MGQNGSENMTYNRRRIRALGDGTSSSDCDCGNGSGDGVCDNGRPEDYYGSWGYYCRGYFDGCGGPANGKAGAGGEYFG